VNVAGSRSATVSAGPMPGSTPTAVPSVAPTNAQNRLPGDSAAEKPSRIALIQPSPSVLVSFDG
jgi:hypothetical protein